MTRPLAFAVILAAVALQAATSHAAILLDNTNNLQASFNGGVTGWGSNSPAYNRINGVTFQVGATSYDVTSVSLGLSYNAVSQINMRLQFWELPTASSAVPANGATPDYTQDYAITASAGSQYYTFAVASGAVNLKANTRYSLGILTDLDSISFEWQSAGTNPTSAVGFTDRNNMVSTNGGATFSSVNVNTLFQLTGDVAAVPEPSTWALAIGGISCIAWGVVRHRRAAVRARGA